METDLYKSRSLSSCIKAAFTLFSTNLKTIFQRSWIAMLVCSISATIIVYTSFKFVNVATNAITIATLPLVAGITGCLLLSILAGTYLIGSITSLLNEESKMTNIRRSFFSLLLLYVIIFIVTAIIVAGTVSISIHLAKTKTPLATTDIYTLGYITVIAIIAITLFIPLIYVISQYIFGKSNKLYRNFGTNLHTGFRHWGFIFGTILMATFITCLIQCITNLPAEILNHAKEIDMQGLMLGDPSGLPSYFTALYLCIIFLTSFVDSFISFIFIFTMYYIYGSVVAREEERKEGRKAISQDND